MEVIFIFGIFVCVSTLVYITITKIHDKQEARLQEYFYRINGESMRWTTSQCRKLMNVCLANFEQLQTNLEIQQKQLSGLFPIKHKPQVFLKGQTMDGKYLVYTLARPALTAGDIKTWTVKFYINGKQVDEKVNIVEVEAFDFKLLKGTTGAKVGVFFTDTSDNAGDEKFCDEFNVIDNISPPPPGVISLTVREETEADADVVTIGKNVEEDE